VTAPEVGPLEVPPEFRRIGFSGDFHLNVVADGLPLWRRMVPCLLGNSGWMALRVNNDDTVTVVRKDAAAIIEAMTGRSAGRMALPIPIDDDDWVTTVSREGLWLRNRGSATVRVVAHQLHGRNDLRAELTRCGRLLWGSRLIRAKSDMPRCRLCLMICLPCRTFADLGLPGEQHVAMCEIGCPCGHVDPVHAAPLPHREQAALIATAYRMINESRAGAMSEQGIIV